MSDINYNKYAKLLRQKPFSELIELSCALRWDGNSIMVHTELSNLNYFVQHAIFDTGSLEYRFAHAFKGHTGINEFEELKEWLVLYLIFTYADTDLFRKNVVDGD